MYDWFQSESEVYEETSQPEHVEEDWPHLMVPVGRADKAALQLRENDIPYRGPNSDSSHMGVPQTPSFGMFYFETIEELQKAVAVIWESDVEVKAVYKDEEVFNTASEIYDFMDTEVEVEIV